MATNKTKIVGLRLENEVAEYFKNKNLKEIVENIYKNRDSEALSDEFNQIEFLYDIDRETLIKNIRWLLDAEKLFVMDGHLKWNPTAVNPEYFSLDDKIDAMNISEKEKVALKHKIAESLVQMNRQDGIGNGAGV